MIGKKHMQTFLFFNYADTFLDIPIKLKIIVRLENIYFESNNLALEWCANAVLGLNYND